VAQLDPSAIHNLLLNLKLQLLGLPNLARWALAAFAGIIILREVATAIWDVMRSRRALRAAPAMPYTDPSIPGPKDRGALPAPNPLDAHMEPAPGVVADRRRSTPLP
jgi:hypothetical protein